MANVTETIHQRIEQITSAIDVLRAELAKAEAKKADLQTALRVLSEVTGDDVSGAERVKAPTASRPAAEKKQLMFAILGVGRDEGLQPADVFKRLEADGIDDISIQVVRTTLWRAAKNGELESDDGRYWKHEAEESLYCETSAHSSSAGMTSGGTQHENPLARLLGQPSRSVEPERGGGT
jgi:hypothetical protein